jgi:hypothetical protein
VIIIFLEQLWILPKGRDFACLHRILDILNQLTANGVHVELTP